MNGHSEECGCEMCHGHGGMDCGHCRFGHHRCMARWIVKLVVLLLVFWFGVQVGETRGAYRDNWYPGYSMMNGYGYYGDGYGMMGGYGPVRAGFAARQATTTVR